MTTNSDTARMGGWARSLEELDREIARMAMLCRVPILDSGVIERVLANDRSVSASDNPVAFAKLRDLLLMHFTLHGRWAKELGEDQTTAIERYVIERLRKTLPDLAANWPPPA